MNEIRVTRVGPPEGSPLDSWFDVDVVRGERREPRHFLALADFFSLRSLRGRSTILKNKRNVGDNISGALSSSTISSLLLK
jgi:hypothetical protein